MGGKPCVMMFYLIMVLLLLEENNAMIIATESPTPQPQPTGNLPMVKISHNHMAPLQAACILKVTKKVNCQMGTFDSLLDDITGRGISANEYALQRKTTLTPKLPEAALQLASAGYSVEHPS
ncbi:hypothetical protein RHGRI_010571 [Rhododendron griersonianum]|uniref:Uncharacterized protein n=1 Tax=Rhododendron griersonianum TaxID=479676 RepID=A0AAV6KJV8_9ERIC|nr:hypothetical protein RHGRI_010571 [Rhododendron griersonianum]